MVELTGKSISVSVAVRCVRACVRACEAVCGRVRRRVPQGVPPAGPPRSESGPGPGRAFFAAVSPPSLAPARKSLKKSFIFSEPDRTRILS